MPDPFLIATVSVLGTLAAVTAIGATARLAGAYMSQRERLAAVTRERDRLAVEIAKLRAAHGNKLYNRALGDLGFAARQAIIHLRALQAEVDSELAVAVKLLDTAPKE